MDIVRFILSIICIIAAVILAFINNSSPKDRLDDIPCHKKKDIPNHTYIERQKCDWINKNISTITGGKEGHKNIESTNTTSKEIHSWYKYKTWFELFDNEEDCVEYLIDRKNAYINFLFVWDKVLKEVLPLIHDKHEYIGVIRADDTKKNMYVHKMERSPVLNKSDSYGAGISEQLVEKYTKIPGYFLFHTHPDNEYNEPFPSDADIFTNLLQCSQRWFVAHVIVCKYGIIMYYLDPEKTDKLIKESALKFFTFCYDLISAWNAFLNSTSPIKIKTKEQFLRTWSYNIVVIPLPSYISEQNKIFKGYVLYDRFIKTKYNLLDKLRYEIKYLEKKEQDDKKNKKLQSKKISKLTIK